MKRWHWILVFTIFIIWIGLLTGIWTTCRDWNMLAAISTWLLLGGIGVAVWQIREARKSTNAQIAMDLFREMRSDRALEILRFIYRLKLEQELQTLSTIDIHNIDYVLDRLDVLGVLVNEGVVDDKIAIDAYAGPPALRCWYQLHQYVKDTRKKRGYFGDYFEAFARRSLDYFKKAGIKVEFYREGEEDNPTDLITELQKEERRPRSLKKIRQDRIKGDG